MVETQEDLLSLSSSVSKIIKRGFGRGPETCYSTIKGNRLYISLRNFMSPAEEILADRKEYSIVTRFRSTVITALSEELLQEASNTVGVPFETLYQDWNYVTNSGILLLVNNNPLPELTFDNQLERRLLQLIRMVGSQIHKVPRETKLIKFTQNTCAIEFNGVLSSLECLLIEKGNSDLLLDHSCQIKLAYYQHKELFEDLFNRVIEDLFMMWDPENNKSYLIFCFNKTKPK
jgi:uncharacterized protein YbcI